ncbi:MAG: hypothetical protein OEW77_03175 [Gemmatimonadota bacterium]|nr:hypothetical protein [Gemmatimonadota bacterium]
MTHISVHSALQASLDAPYSDLVTRRTGAAVRTVIEHQLSGLADGSVAFLDFSRIGVLDRSCADEFVAKLMLPLSNDHPSRDGYVVFHGVNELHLEIIESVLLAHGLALVVQFPDGAARLVGAVTDVERRLWELVMRQGWCPAERLAAEAGITPDEAQGQLEGLARRRLIRRDADAFAPLGAAA